ncbi:MAG TPA: DUF2922 domain-containing protein [Bacilli bacterium]|nr:DUF2922 domain-containing protein [Bacilli bacterium]
MKRELELIFLTVNNKKVKLVVPEPRADLTLDEVNTVMDLVIAKNVFGFTQGTIVAKEGARIVETAIEELAI